MSDFNERSAYPSPDDFEVMRPEYEEMDDSNFEASITITPFRVTGISSTKPGARRAALYEAEKTYRSYHPSYRIRIPYPENFVDQEGMKWKQIPPQQREQLGDYRFTDPDGEEDFADVETMLLWDVRPAAEDEG